MPEENELERPAWLAEKFKSPEDLATSYTEAERRILELQGQLEEERSNFGNALTNLQGLVETQQPQQQQAYNPQEDPLLLQYQQAVDNGDARAMLAIQLELNRQMTQSAIENGMKELGTRIDKGQETDRDVALTLATERVGRAYDNWEELAPQVGKMLQENPNWMPNSPSVDGYAQAIQTAAKLVVADQLIAANQESEGKRQQKIAAQGLTGEGARQVIETNGQQTTWQDVKDAPLGGYGEIFRSLNK